jgi:hypothetical protein
VKICLSNMHIDIRKPLYGSFVNLREDHLKQAIKKGEAFYVSIKGGPKVKIDPQEWIRTGKKAEQVFRFKDRPMKLVGNYVQTIPITESRESKKEVCGTCEKNNEADCGIQMCLLR